MAKNQQADEKLADRDADALWVVLRAAIAASGLPGKRIAEEAEIGWSTLRQYASKARTPSASTLEKIVRVLKTHGVTMDLPERTVKITRLPKHIPGEHKGQTED